MYVFGINGRLFVCRNKWRSQINGHLLLSTFKCADMVQNMNEKYVDLHEKKRAIIYVMNLIYYFILYEQTETI